MLIKGIYIRLYVHAHSDDPHNIAQHIPDQHTTNNSGEVIALLLVAQSSDPST
ncbi:hypothetical protein M422DRAFT_250163 [Sphaerobolus stellatus SS14]|uniref:Unplaced genomic scaffold SPHSTscaffold_33, whole genome shotgun sequence n=1 Tax=Sphaerobolus stellatus (strain SS14) TaxID=990650 RepID=A0A0C9W477_SPHS4|nr:hypothetical protein M422DRAFT_250163 [Sphaerobolus stellatus SS14]